MNRLTQDKAKYDQYVSLASQFADLVRGKYEDVLPAVNGYLDEAEPFEWPRQKEQPDKTWLVDQGERDVAEREGPYAFNSRNHNFMIAILAALHDVLLVRAVPFVRPETFQSRDEKPRGKGGDEQAEQEPNRKFVHECRRYIYWRGLLKRIELGDYGVWEFEKALEVAKGHFPEVGQVQRTPNDEAERLPQNELLLPASDITTTPTKIVTPKKTSTRTVDLAVEADRKVVAEQWEKYVTYAREKRTKLSYEGFVAWADENQVDLPSEEPTKLKQMRDAYRKVRKSVVEVKGERGRKIGNAR